jgi:Tfp pilus assembly protein PilF
MSMTRQASTRRHTDDQASARSFNRVPNGPRVSRLTLAFVAVLTATTLGCTSLNLPASPKRNPAREQERKREQVVQNFEQRRNEAQCRAALARWQQGDTASCESLLVQLLGHTPDDCEARRLLADLYLAQQQPASALDQLQQLVEQHPDDAQAHHSLGLLFESLGRMSDALEHFDLAVELEPKNGLYALSRGAASEEHAELRSPVRTKL